MVRKVARRVFGLAREGVTLARTAMQSPEEQRRVPEELARVTKCLQELNIAPADREKVLSRLQAHFENGGTFPDPPHFQEQLIRSFL